MLPMTALRTNSSTVSSMRNMLVSVLDRGTALTEPLRATSQPTVMQPAQPARSRRHLISHGNVLYVLSSMLINSCSQQTDVSSAAVTFRRSAVQFRYSLLCFSVSIQKVWYRSLTINMKILTFLLLLLQLRNKFVNYGILNSDYKPLGIVSNLLQS